MVDGPPTGAQDPSGPGWQPARADADLPSASPWSGPPSEPAPSRPTGGDAGRSPARPEPAEGSPAAVEGVVRGLSQRVEQPSGNGPEQVWTFRVDQHDERGNRLRPIPVELRGERFRGVVADGDRVRVAGRWRRGTLHAQEVTNVTTGGALVVRSWTTARLVVVGVVLTLMTALVLAFVVGFVGTRDDVRRGIEQQQGEAEDIRQRVDDLRREVEEGTAP